jgi:hypothetical protein
MDLHGALGATDPFRDLRVAEPIGNEPQHLELARR